jgi:hypothetical protein
MAYTYRERRYYCGNYLEIDVFPVFPVARSRQKKEKPTSEVQQKLNEHNAEQKLIRILNANFTSDDIEIHLTFADENLPADDEEAARDIQNFLRRVKRLRKKNGLPELKYVCVTEGGSEGKRYHYHVTMNGGLDRDELEKLWGYGYANSRRLQFNENGVEGLARYVTKQFREKKENGETIFRKRWTASKNLIIPPPKDRDGRISEKRVRAIATSEIINGAVLEQLYPGYSFASCRPFHNEVNGGYYLCVRMYKSAAALANRKRKRKGG